MCNFLSGLTFGPKLENRFGRFYSDPQTTDSHSDMEAKLKLSDRHIDPHWAKWEFTPGPNGYADFDGYKFRLDEDRKPSWWDEYIEADTIAYAKSKLAEAVVTSGFHEVRDGKIIAAGTATVHACNSSTVEAYGSSTVEACNSSTVKAFNSSTVKAFNSSTVKAWDSSTVKAYGSSTVEAWGSSTVEARNSSTVEACDSSTVEAYGSSTVTQQSPTANVTLAEGSRAVLIDRTGPRPKCKVARP